MRRKERSITDPAALAAILDKAHVLRLAMCDGERPYLLPLNFGYSEGRIYIHCAREGRKLDLLRRNPRVCFEASVDMELAVPDDPKNACGYTMHYRCVIGEGRATVLEDPEEVRHGLEAVMAHYGSGPFVYSDAAAERVAVIRIEVEHLSGKQSPA